MTLWGREVPASSRGERKNESCVAARPFSRLIEEESDEKWKQRVPAQTPSEPGCLVDISKYLLSARWSFSLHLALSTHPRLIRGLSSNFALPFASNHGVFFHSRAVSIHGGSFCAVLGY